MTFEEKQAQLDKFNREWLNAVLTKETIIQTAISNHKYFRAELRREKSDRPYAATPTEAWYRTYLATSANRWTRFITMYRKEVTQCQTLRK